MNDLISRQAAIDAIMGEPTDAHYPSWYAERLEQLPSAQQERIIYGNMSDEEFEKWLYGHGICSPNIHESIPCDAVPLLIDNAISELPSAQPDIIQCRNCKFASGDSRICMKFGHSPIGELDFCAWAERRTDE